MDVWLPYDLVGDTGSQNYGLTAVGRLRNGVSLQQAQAELAVLSQAMKERWPDARLTAVVALPLQDLVAASLRSGLAAAQLALALKLMAGAGVLRRVFIICGRWTSASASSASSPSR